MKFGFISSLLLAGLAAAAPLTEKRMERRANSRRSNPAYAPNKFGIEPLNVTKTSNSNISNVEYSSNWAGAVLVGSGYSAVSAIFTVPTPSAPGGGLGQYCATAWVGLDGDTCDSSILQTGVDFCVDDGYAYYSAWYEWFPAYSITFDGFGVGAGDVIKVSVDAYSTTSGIAVVENLSTGQTVSHTFEGESDALCEWNAEWIVEDFEEGDSLVNFADFGTVTFSECAATDYGATVDTTGSTIMDIVEGFTVVTSVEASGSTVTVQYI